MRLRKVRVIGFQSFGDSGEVHLSDGVNLVVGQNNAGKSALLRALQPQLADDRHRTRTRWEEFRLAPPTVHLGVEVSGNELQDVVLQRSPSYIPAPIGGDPVTYVKDLLARPNLEFNVAHSPNREFTAPYPGHGLFNREGNSQQHCAAITPHDGELTYRAQARGDDSTASLVHSLWHTNMFYFSAERMTIGESVQGYAERLQPDAGNLAGVLDTLKGNRGDVFARLVWHLREIFPTVGNLSVRPKPNSSNMVEVRVWPTETMEHVQLSFPLNSSGTGVSQVIALLTAIMTVQNAVIVIDEINSFLHPAAVKALLRILQTEYAQHQYIISTHAPEVIGFSNPRTIHLVKRDGYESSVHRLDLEEVDQFREIAEHLGVSMADVFAAERVIWVEGPTEELCFPLLYRQATSEALPRGTIFTSVVATGDFIAKKRDTQLVFEIYRKLSRAASPLTIAVAFSFDSEELSDGEKEDMVRRSKGAMHFLPRRHLECYMIDPTAIAAFICEKDPASVGAVTFELVAEHLTQLAGGSFQIEDWKGDLTDEAWLRRVDAAKLIAATCADLSEQRATFKKKDDTLNLLQKVQGSNPAQLTPLAEYVANLVRTLPA